MEWTGRWIWDKSEENPRNFYWCARKIFTLPKKFERVTLHITADSRYHAYINGGLTGFGPVRAFTHNWRYDTCDITSSVTPGKNIIAALVQHYGHGTFQYLEARGGLLAQIECDGKVVAATDRTWRGSVHPSYERRQPRMSMQTGWTEEYDARIEPAGWTGLDFKDSGWKKAVEVGEAGCEPWLSISPRDIPYLTYEPIYPSRIYRKRLVNPPSQVWSMDLKPNIVPGDLTANHNRLPGVLAVVLYCSEDTTVTIKMHHNRPREFAVDGNAVSNADFEKGIKLTTGDHLLTADTDKGFHEWFMTFIIENDKGVVTPRSVFGDKSIYPFCTVGPFAKDEREDLEKVFRAVKPSEIVSHPRVKPIDRAHTADSHVAALTEFAYPAEGEPKIENPGAMLAANDETTIIFPAEGDTEIIVDFGKEVYGYIEMEMRAPEGVIIDMNGIEHILDGRIQWPRCNLNNTFRYITNEGPQSWVSVTRRGLRYAILTVRFPKGKTEPLEIENIFINQTVYPYTERGSFQSSDALLNKAWEISGRTVRLCSEDTFTDCPAFEQTFWVGDARNESLFSYTAFGDYRIARRCLLLAAESLYRSPIVESQVPSSWEALLPAWSLFWTIACEEYYHYSGDMEFLNEIYGAVRLQNENIYEEFINKDGLFEINAWNMLDWAGMDTPNSGVITHQNMWLVEALKRSAKMAETLNIKEDAELFTRLAKKLKAAINKHLWSEKKQAYYDSIHADGKPSRVVSEQTQTVACLCEIAPPEKKETLEKYLVKSPKGWVKTGSPFMMAFTLEALGSIGNASQILKLIRKWWGMMLDEGSTTCWETFNHDSDGWPTRSRCHAWSAAPSYALPTWILGVKPIEPGFKTFEVSPNLCDLDFARGTVPTPHGDIEVDVQRGKDSLVLSVRVPEGTSAKIRGKTHNSNVNKLELKLEG